MSSNLLNLFVICNVLFEENFNNGIENWTHSYWKGEYSADFVSGKGSFFADEVESMALMTNASARFYTIAKNFEEFSNSGKDLFVQYTVKNEQNIDCGGAYLKLFPPGVQLENIKGGESETPYNIMFGPDICGSTKKVHFIMRYNETNLELKKPVACSSDQFTHHYMFALNKNGTYSLFVNDKEEATGELRTDWSFLQPRTIKDPDVFKPTEWVDDPYMDDPSDFKPEGWDDIPAQINDPDAKTPDDWNEDEDGEWEAPMIDNPEFKGEWKVKRIANPDYKGEWQHPLIDNPDYKDDEYIGNYTFGAIGFEIWQVKAGTAFDSIHISDNEEEAMRAKDKALELKKKESERYDEQQKKDQSTEADDLSEHTDTQEDDEEVEKDEL